MGWDKRLPVFEGGGGNLGKKEFRLDDKCPFALNLTDF